MYHHRERNSWMQQVRLIFLKHSCQSVLNYPRDQCATSIHQSRKTEISLHGLCHASFPLNHTERNGNIAQFLEQHFAFMLWYLPQPILLAFSFLTKEGAKYFVRKKSCVLKTYEKRLIFSHWPACAESHQKVLALSSSSNLGIGDFGFALRNQVLIHDSTQGVGVSQQSGLGAIECTGYSGHHYWSAQICSDLWEEHCL